MKHQALESAYEVYTESTRRFTVSIVLVFMSVFASVSFGIAAAILWGAI